MLGYSYPKWTAIYVCTKYEAQAVIVTSIEEPAPKRTFRIPGKGRVAFSAASITPLRQPKEGIMAKRRTKKEAEPETEVDDDLEDLEDLDDDLEDLEDLEEEEPEVDEDEDEEDEDEEEDLTDLSLKVLRSRATAAGLSAAKAKAQKGDKGKAALAKYILANEGDDDDEEEEEEEAPPKKKRAKKGSGKGKGGNAPPTRELPKGKLGAQDVADAAGVDARAVRVFLRKNTDEFPKDEELGRYAFNKTQVKQIVKAMKAASRKAADDE